MKETKKRQWRRTLRQEKEMTRKVRTIHTHSTHSYCTPHAPLNPSAQSETLSFFFSVLPQDTAETFFFESAQKEQVLSVHSQKSVRMCHRVHFSQARNEILNDIMAPDTEDAENKRKEEEENKRNWLPREGRGCAENSPAENSNKHSQNDSSRGSKSQ